MPGTSRLESRGTRGAALIAFLAVGALALPAFAATLANYPDFSDVTGLQLNGDASQETDVLRLTEDAGDEQGTAFTMSKVVRANKSWKSNFVFAIGGTGFPGDGMAFLVHGQESTVIGDGGGGLGYGSIGSSVAVEFDTFDNGGANEAENEVAIVFNGKAGKPAAREDPGFGIHGGGVLNAWVKYSAASKRTKVWVDDDDTRPNKPLLSAKRNLENVLDGKSRAGFTATTGGATEFHDVLSWKLTQ